MTVYPEATTYLEGLELAAKDSAYETDFQKAIEHAIRVFKLNKQRITDGQKLVGNHPGEAKIVTLKHTVYFGMAQEGGVLVDVVKK